MTKELMNFDDYCKNYIIENLEDYIGTVCYMCELGYTITEGINANRTATYSTHEAMQYIQKWWYEASAYWNYEKFEFGENMHNPFENVEAYMVCMIIYGVSSLLGQCEVVDDNWNDEKEITEEMVKAILKEIEDKEVLF